MNRYFESIFGWRRGSKQRREEQDIEDKVVDVALAHAFVGVTATAIAGCLEREQPLIDASLATAESYFRIHRRANGRWYPGGSER
jgi:hypothetical protein